jgi:hypothetical protein
LRPKTKSRRRRGSNPAPAVRDFTSFGFKKVFNGRTNEIKGVSRQWLAPIFIPSILLFMTRYYPTPK